MSSSADVVTTLDGLSAVQLAERYGLPHVALLASVTSTLDVAHELASRGATAGTLVIADEQTAGRGRQGRSWTSSSGLGLWLTMIERPAEAAALDVLALRCGLFAAEALDVLAAEEIRLKWPNDLYVGECKLAGILIEVRWRGTSPEWVAIGFGVNVIAPDVHSAAGLQRGTSRLAALDLLVPALRRAAACRGHLTEKELAAFRTRDLSVGRIALTPGAGVVQGITSAGELAVDVHGALAMYRSGSLTFATPLQCS